MEDTVLRLLYGNAPGRFFLCLLLKLGFPRLMAAYLNSRRSQKIVPAFIEKHGISMQDYPQREYESFAAFFAREKICYSVDSDPTHFSSPCDGLLSAYRISEDSRFQIKGSCYRICDLVGDPSTSADFIGGLCLIFRLTPSDCHRYIFPDDGYIRDHHFMEGTLHSVQPIACESFPVYRLNRRCWTVLETEHFGNLIQIEVGALAVGGIVNEKKESAFWKGEEMGHFTLCGSTIVVLVQENRLRLLPEIEAATEKGHEFRVEQGDWIATQAYADYSGNDRARPAKYIFHPAKDHGT